MSGRRLVAASVPRPGDGTVKLLAGRPPWREEPKQTAVDMTECQAPGCVEEAVGFVPRLGVAVCPTHARKAQVRLGRDAVARLVDCPCCLRRAPFGVRLIFRGEHEGRDACDGCAERVKDALAEEQDS